MLRCDTAGDPVVEILQLAYRRGLAILREQQEAREAANTPALKAESGKAEMWLQHREILGTKKVKGGE